jgi:hypothetical protein
MKIEIVSHLRGFLLFYYPLVVVKMKLLTLNTLRPNYENLSL